MLIIQHLHGWMIWPPLCTTRLRLFLFCIVKHVHWQTPGGAQSPAPLNWALSAERVLSRYSMIKSSSLTSKSCSFAKVTDLQHAILRKDTNKRLGILGKNRHFSVNFVILIYHNDLAMILGQSRNFLSKKLRFHKTRYLRQKAQY